MADAEHDEGTGEESGAEADIPLRRASAARPSKGPSLAVVERALKVFIEVVLTRAPNPQLSTKALCGTCSLLATEALPKAGEKSDGYLTALVNSFLEPAAQKHATPRRVWNVVRAQYPKSETTLWRPLPPHAPIPYPPAAMHRP